MAEKKLRTLGDYIRVELAKGVEPVVIERKNMTDEEWRRVRRSALESGQLVDDEGKKVEPRSAFAASFDKGESIFDKKPEEKRPASTEPEPENKNVSEKDRKQIDQLKRKIDKQVRDNYDAQHPELQDLQLERTDASKGGGSTMMAKAASMLQDTATGAAPSSLDSTNKKINSISGEAMSELPGEDPAKQRRLNLLRAELQDETDPAKQRRLNLLRAELESDPRLRSDLLPPEPDFMQVGTMTRVVQPQKFGNDAVSAAAAEEGIPSSAPVPVDPDAGPMFDAPTDNSPPTGPLARFLLPQTTAAAEYQPGSEAPAQVPAAGQVPGQAQSPSQTAPQQGEPGGSVTLKTKVSTPGSGELPPQMDPYADERRRMENAAEGAKQAHQKLAGVERSRAEAESKILNDKILFTAENEKKRLEAVRAYEETLARGQQTMNMIADERRKLMNTRIDPDAYYTKGGVGRAVLATISGAMFGWVGQGMQYLQRLDNLAQQEVKNQQDELARRSGELSLIAADKKNVIAMAREAGLSQIESLAAAKVSFFESVKDQLAKVAADNPTLAAQAQMKMAEIDQKLAGDLMALEQATQTTAHQRVQDRIAMMNAQTNRMEAYAKIAAAGAKGAGGGKPLPEAGVKLLDGYSESLQIVQQMRELAQNTGWMDRAGQKAAQATPFGFAEDKAKGKQFEGLKINWMTGKAKGALQKHELDLLAPLLGERGQLGSDPIPNLQLAEKLALEQLDRAIASHRANGWDTTGYEQQRNKLAAQMSTAVPGEKPYGVQ